MKRFPLFVALGACALSFSAPLSAQDVPDTRPGIAILPFENNSVGPDKAEFELFGGGLQQMIGYELAVNTNLRVIDRAILREILAEQDLGASGRVDAETAARIGRIVGAKFVVIGSFTDDSFGASTSNNAFTVNSRVVDSETSEWVRPAQARGPRASMYGLIVDLAAQLTRDLKLPELPASVREARTKRDIPPEALMRHARVLSYQDRGDTERAVELYRQLVDDFPQVEEWKAELRQLTSG
jgi:TolB-like protein